MQIEISILMYLIYILEYKYNLKVAIIVQLVDAYIYMYLLNFIAYINLFLNQYFVLLFKIL